MAGQRNAGHMEIYDKKHWFHQKTMRSDVKWGYGKRRGAYLVPRGLSFAAATEVIAAIL